MKKICKFTEKKAECLICMNMVGNLIETGEIVDFMEEMNYCESAKMKAYIGLYMPLKIVYTGKVEFTKAINKLNKQLKIKRQRDSKGDILCLGD